jgi:hypothetical protein
MHQIKDIAVYLMVPQKYIGQICCSQSTKANAFDKLLSLAS